MVSIQPATAADIPELCAFLSRHLDPALGPDDFLPIFTYPWMSEKPDLGLLIRDGGRIAGFFGAIYSDREFDGRILRFCNLSSLCVLPAYRQQTLAMFSRLHRQPGVIFTNFSSRPAVEKMSLAFRYRVIDRFKLFALPLAQFWTLASGSISLLEGAAAILPLLPPHLATLFRDHLATTCRHLLLQATDGRLCYLVAKRRVKKSIPFTEILFCSDPPLLARHFERVKLRLLLSDRSLMLAIDERLLQARLPLMLPVSRACLVRGEMASIPVDNLYSELALL